MTSRCIHTEAAVACTNRALWTVPYCPEHLRSVCLLDRRQTTLMNASTGKRHDFHGLFVHSPLAGDRAVFQNGDNIAWFVGEKMNYDEAFARYGLKGLEPDAENPTSTLFATHLVMVCKKRFIDTALVRGVASAANTLQRGDKLATSQSASLNAKLRVSMRTGDAKITATRTLRHGEEIFFAYDIKDGYTERHLTTLDLPDETSTTA